MIDYPPSLIQTDLDGSNPITITDKIFVDNPDYFRIWFALDQPFGAKCGTSCNNNAECVNFGNSCTRCNEGKCSPTNGCGGSCDLDTDCGGNCTVCLSNVCRPQPYCGMECVNDSDCSTVSDLCPLCVSDVNNIKRCLPNPPTNYKPGVMLSARCLNSSLHSVSNCMVTLYNLTSGQVESSLKFQELTG
jgi:hypothetical protein